MLTLLRMRNGSNSSSEAALTQEADRSMAECQKVINMPCAKSENQVPSGPCEMDYSACRHPGNTAHDWESWESNSEWTDSRLGKTGSWNWIFTWDYVPYVFYFWARIGACKGIEICELIEKHFGRHFWLVMTVVLRLLLYLIWSFSILLPTGVVVILPPGNRAQSSFTSCLYCHTLPRVCSQDVSTECLR